MRKLTKDNENGYKIAEDDYCFYVYLQDEKANVGISYEYDKACGTREEVEKELQSHSFKEMVKRYKEQCVYCECVEPLY